MKLIIGLGNPGKQYEITRHNVGFIIIDYLSQYLKAPLLKNKFNGNYSKTVFQGEEIILLTPLTYMNLSGDCVINFMNYFKIPSSDILIIHDEIDLEFGKMQFKNTGSLAGHNGLKDIFAKSKNNDFTRLRIGVGKNPKFKIADWVLSSFTYHELLAFNKNQELLVTAVLNWATINNLDVLMSKYNNQTFN